MLTEDGVKKIAQLARIKLTDEQAEKLRTDMSSILDYINQLNEVDTKNTEPIFQTTGIINSLRDDVSRGDSKTEGLIEQAPRSQDNLVKVGSVLNRTAK
jgi:aspartyl-tRNA(Asn)/glutamyl-tRNA(Gln) amidotransferase subunit C